MSLAQHVEMDPERLLLKLSTGKRLTAAEVRSVVEVLEGSSEDSGLDDSYSCLLIIGRAELKEHRRLVERHLETKDPLTVSLALEILCLQWRTTEDYLERALDFALGVSWDEDDDVRGMSLRILGEYLRDAWNEVIPTSGSDKQLKVLGLVLSVFDDDALDPLVRQAAYNSLCRAAGKPWEELPSECVLLDLAVGSKDVDWTMLERLRQLSLSSPEASESPSSGRSSVKSSLRIVPPGTT